jgi:hypothetical protein
MKNIEKLKAAVTEIEHSNIKKEDKDTIIEILDSNSTDKKDINNNIKTLNNIANKISTYTTSDCKKKHSHSQKISNIVEMIYTYTNNLSEKKTKIHKSTLKINNNNKKNIYNTTLEFQT